MAHPERLFLPKQDTYTAPIEATERALQALPIEGCELVRNDEMGHLEYIAPVGKAFRIVSPDLRLSRIKPVYVSRSEADGDIPQDPYALEDAAPWESPDIGEHVATRLSLRANGRMLGEKALKDPSAKDDNWTQHPHAVSSDEVTVDVVLLDPPQAWTVHGLTSVPLPENSSPYSFTHPWVGYYAEEPIIASRQAFVAANLDGARVELVDIDYDAVRQSSDTPTTPDGRVLQLAGMNDPQPGGEVLEIITFDEGTRAEYIDELYMEDPWYRQTYGHIPRAERLEALWRSSRKTFGRYIEKTRRQPFADDPLRSFELVIAHDDGSVPSMEEILAHLEETARISRMKMHEVDAEANKPLDADTYRRHGAHFFELIAPQGSLANTVAAHCGPDWALATGQRRTETLFGYRRFPDQFIKQADALGRMSLEEAVAEYATDDWRVRDGQMGRIAEKPRDVDQYFDIIRGAYERRAETNSEGV